MIKLLACLFMLIDHIGIIFFPGAVGLRLVGRLSMPLYAYCIARGIRYTRDIKKYLLRVLCVACAAQIPFMLMVGELKLNICFLWAGSICLIWALKARKSTVERLLLISAGIIACALISVDYGAYGLLWVLILYRYGEREQTAALWASWAALHMAALVTDIHTGSLRLFTLPALAIIDLCVRCGLEKKKRSSAVLNWFYPAHITVLLILKAVSSNI